MRNKYTQNAVKSWLGEIPMEIPRDRNGEFEPIIIPKNKKNISRIEEKVIVLYGRGMSTRDINEQIKDIYGIELSAGMVIKILDK